MSGLISIFEHLKLGRRSGMDKSLTREDFYYIGDSKLVLKEIEDVISR